MIICQVLEFGEGAASNRTEAQLPHGGTVITFNIRLNQEIKLN